MLLGSPTVTQPHPKRLRMPKLRALPAGIFGGSLVAAIVALSTATPAQSQFMALEDVKPGMKGYGLTVFSGTKPERFDVEVISTFHNFRPKQDLILIKTPHPRLNIARTVAGMSGSPIYINGKMIGAYAYGWFFNVEPIAGVTPIQNMMNDLKRPIPYALAPAGRSPMTRAQTAVSSAGASRSPNRFRGKVLAYNLNDHASQLARRTAPALAPPHGSQLRPASTDVMVGGLGPRSLTMVADLLAPVGMNVVQAGGGSHGGSIPADAPKNYVDGGVINVQLARGDVSLSGLGTVTHVVGDKLVAFGHPMLNGGVEALPTAIGKVHWVLATQNRSFKIGEPLRPLGTLINDRQASIVVDTTRRAPTFPVSVTVEGVPGAANQWNMEVAHDQFLAPSLTAVVIGNALETTSAERNDLTWRATSVLEVEGHGSMTLVDFGANNRMPLGPSDFGRTRLIRALGMLLNNPWEIGKIKGIKTTVAISHVRDVKHLRGAQLLDAEIDPGEPARVKLTFKPMLGPEHSRIIEVPIDPMMAGRTVHISLRPGYSQERIVAPPESYADLVALLPKLSFPGESLIASYQLPNESGAAYRGNVAKRLPPGAVDTLMPTSRSIVPRTFNSVRQLVIPTKGFVVGADSFSVHVRPAIR